MTVSIEYIAKIKKPKAVNKGEMAMKNLMPTLGLLASASLLSINQAQATRYLS